MSTTLGDLKGLDMRYEQAPGTGAREVVKTRGNADGIDSAVDQALRRALDINSLANHSVKLVGKLNDKDETSECYCFRMLSMLISSHIIVQDSIPTTEFMRYSTSIPLD